jgi:ubiquinone/menaquinone biosynthesis C-methylase UbiE
MRSVRQLFKSAATTMGQRSNIEWRRFGNLDPLYGVASWEGRNKRGPNPWTEAEFYGSGAVNCAEYVGRWESYGLNKRSCLEIGCGAGRITKHLAGYFSTVHAVDVSEGMLAMARKNITAPNCVFYLSDGASLPMEDGSATAAFSCDVFQHFNVRDVAKSYFEEIYRVLDHGGSMMIELPVYQWPSPARLYQPIHWLAQAGNLARAELRRLLLGTPFMHIVPYEIPWLAKTLAVTGFQDEELAFFYNTGEGRRRFFRPWLFARRP